MDPLSSGRELVREILLRMFPNAGAMGDNIFDNVVRQQPVKVPGRNLTISIDFQLMTDLPRGYAPVTGELMAVAKARFDFNKPQLPSEEVIADKVSARRKELSNAYKLDQEIINRAILNTAQLLASRS